MSIEVVSPIAGIIHEIFVTIGDRVEAGEQIMVIEAMKMEHSIFTSVPGQIAQVLVEEDQKVQVNQVLLLMDEGL